jgi:hypothetical protein
MSERRRSVDGAGGAWERARGGVPVRTAPFGRADPVRAPPDGFRLRFFATYGAIELKSNSDGIGSGSSSSVP